MKAGSEDQINSKNPPRVLNKHSLTPLQIPLMVIVYFSVTELRIDAGAREARKDFRLPIKALI